MVRKKDIIKQLDTENNYSLLINKWLEDEQNGVKFPVDFDVAWKIAGYAKKQSAKNKLKYLVENEDYALTRLSKCVKGNRGGGFTRYDEIKLTSDAFKHFCLLAQTNEGKKIRQYFIEIEKNWQVLQHLNPNYAQEIELIKLENERLKLETEKEKAIAKSKEFDLKLTQFRHTITTTCPESIQQKILGYQIVKQEPEIIEKTIDTSTGKTYDGVGITFIRKSLGFSNNNQCWNWLESVGYGKNSSHWKNELSAVNHKKLSRDDLQYLMDIFPESKNRQLFLCE